MNPNSKKVKKPSIEEESHSNFMGGKSFEVSPFIRLFIMSASSFFSEPAYYQEGNSEIALKIEEELNTDLSFNERNILNIFGSIFSDSKHSSLIDRLQKEFQPIDNKMSIYSKLPRNESMFLAIRDSLRYDPELTLKYFAWLRNKGLIRTTPQVALAIASNLSELKGSGLITKYSGLIFSRLDDMSSCLAYYLNKFGKPIPNSLKKAMRKRIMYANKYEIAKYKNDTHNVSMKDIIKLTHAKSKNIDALMNNELKLNAENNTETWESILSKNGASKESWESVLTKDIIGHMALLRNIRNLQKYKVDTSLYLDKLISGVKNGKQLPFRYLSAIESIDPDFKIQQALEKCFELSISNIERFKGRSLILVDNSGSALGAKLSEKSERSVSDIGNLMGIITSKLSDYGKIGVFGDTVKFMSVNKDNPTFETFNVLNELADNVGMATETGIWIAFDTIIKNKEPFDRIFIFSDMQAGTGELYAFDSCNNPKWNKNQINNFIDIPSLIKKYRDTVNPNCFVHSVQLAGYSDNIVPETFNKTSILSGWSPRILDFAHVLETEMTNIEDIFRNKTFQELSKE